MSKQKSEDGFFAKAENFHLRCLAHVLHLGAQALILGIEGKKLKKDPKLQAFICDDPESLEYLKSTVESQSSELPKKTNLVKSLRTVILKLRRSEGLLNFLYDQQQKHSIVTSNPVLDIKTRWNSTYLMVEWALKNKKVSIFV